MPFQFGWCNGHNIKLNCLECHRDSEFNLSPGDFILLLAKLDEIADGKLDTGRVKAFRVPAATLVEVYCAAGVGRLAGRRGPGRRGGGGAAQRHQH